MACFFFWFLKKINFLHTLSKETAWWGRILQKEQGCSLANYWKATILHLHISHNPCLPPKTLHNLCFWLFLGITIIPREIKDNAYAKSWGANKVYHGRCANGELEKSMKGKSPFSLSIPLSFSSLLLLFRRSHMHQLTKFLSYMTVLGFLPSRAGISTYYEHGSFHWKQKRNRTKTNS